MTLVSDREKNAPVDERTERIECVGTAGCASPEVSFIVAAYNVAPYIEAAIRSALGQVDACVEVVVVDDASTDATADTVAPIARADPRVRLICRAVNAGPSAARNDAIASARAPWIAILDGDDLIAPERTRRLLDLAEATSADIVADNFERFVVEGEPLGQPMIRHRDAPFVLQVDVPAFLRGNCALSRPGFSLGAVKCLFRADFLRAHALRHPENLDFGEDYHFVLSCLMAGARFFVTTDTFYAYRLRASSVSWRMTARHIGRLLVEHRAMRLEERYRDEPDVIAAAADYARSLERALDFMRVVDLAKQMRWREALAKAATRPAAWPLFFRFGGHTLLKRAGLMQA
jgi:succinoglycan biosynthesis protein ExoO